MKRPHLVENIFENFLEFLAVNKGKDKEALIQKFLDIEVDIFCRNCRGLINGCDKCKGGIVKSTHREEVWCKNSHMYHTRR